MYDEAPELDETLMSVVRSELRAHTEGATDIDIASVAVDIVRAIVLAGYSIRRIEG